MKWFEEMKQLLRDSGEAEFYELHFFETVDSTNEVCKRAAAEGAGEGWLAAADEQTAGKGRLGRRWVSPAGEAVYFSFILRPSCAPRQAYALTLVTGLAVCTAVREFTGLDAGIKWPNDIVISGKKICGILTEADASGGRLGNVVVGTGINVNNRSFSGDIADRATSLLLENGGIPVSRGGITAEVLRHFRRYYMVFLETGDLGKLAEIYNPLLVSREKTVRVEDPLGAYCGTSHGIDRTGSLLVTAESGELKKVTAGEVSVRGLYGYI